MTLFTQIKALVKKDLTLEWRSKVAVNSVLLYVVSTVFVCYQAFKSLDPTVWNALFWIILLFASITAMTRSFAQETQQRFLYYYSLIDPRALIISKIIYNTTLMLVIASIAYISYSTIFQMQIGDSPLYFLTIVLGAVGFACIFTMVSAISAKTGNNSTIMSILSFPVIIPMLVVLISASNNALKGAERAESIKDLVVIVAINIVSIAISLLLFPYLWRD